MRGSGLAHGALSVLNAIPTGIGGAVSIDLFTEARVEVYRREVYEGYSRVMGEEIPIEVGILRSIATVASGKLGYTPGISAVVESNIPPAKGLKSSSALVVSILKAVLSSHRVRASFRDLATMGVRASTMAGLTITGALDDHMAALGRGLYLTDNEGLRLLLKSRALRAGVVLRIPERSNPIKGVGREGFQALRPRYMEAVREALSGRWLRAMTINGTLTAIAVGEDLGPILEALKTPGVLAAGITGKGPAMFALTRKPELVRDLWEGSGGLIMESRILV